MRVTFSSELLFSAFPLFPLQMIAIMGWQLLSSTNAFSRYVSKKLFSNVSCVCVLLSARRIQFWFYAVFFFLHQRASTWEREIENNNTYWMSFPIHPSSRPRNAAATMLRTWKLFDYLITDNGKSCTNLKTPTANSTACGWRHNSNDNFWMCNSFHCRQRNPLRLAFHHGGKCFPKNWVKCFILVLHEFLITLTFYVRREASLKKKELTRRWQEVVEKVFTIISEIRRKCFLLSTCATFFERVETGSFYRIFKIP